MIKNINIDSCIRCGLCEAVCPGDVIRCDEETKEPAIVYASDCWSCFSCELVCPVNAIDVSPFRKVKPMAW